jgi:putative membrane protein
MSARHFYLDSTRKAVGEAVGRIESRTGAEVVVAVRPMSGHYRHADYLVGFAFVMAGLCFFLFYPVPFRDDVFPFEAALLFVVGTVVSANVPDVRRLLTLPSRRRAAVATAARAALVELGVTATRERTGLLVYVSVFERAVEVVGDVGLAALTQHDSFHRAVEGLNGAVHPPRVDRFIAALESLGQTLESCAPRRDDDTNELPNEPRMS